MPSEQAVASSVDQLLEEACARNIPAELHYESRTGERSISRVRLLEMTPAEILSDTPLVMDAQPPIPPNRPITVHMVLNGSRWQFDSTINKTGLDVRLNEHETLKGISLQRPNRIEPSQRRADYRISLASLDPILVQMVRPHRDNPQACAWPGTRVEARAIDLSAGGMALLLKRDIIREAKRDETFFLSFSLPDTEDSFQMMGSVRHMRLLHDDTSLRLACAFEEWGSGALKADQTRIARFIADCQRNSIRRRK